MTTKKLLLLAGALLGWIAILVQLVLIIQNRVASIPETIVRFFSFFTILTNIIVAVFFTVLYAKRNEKKLPSFLSANNQTAVAVYILVVGIVYNVVLRFLWAPVGYQRIVDELLHLVIPLLYFFYWLRFVPKNNLQWKYLLRWLVYPITYLVFILIRGAMANPAFYPYPFVDVYKLGYPKVMTNCVFVMLLFLLISIVFIAAGRYSKKKMSAEILN
ncbi:MAG: Pr6Pr family membrane protein [Gloeobacteraceae cyanobacterium ES-bin-316]|nr:Pr6Pr family membrane protein [Ferruginibacter sp.]